MLLVFVSSNGFIIYQKNRQKRKDTEVSQFVTKVSQLNTNW